MHFRVESRGAKDPPLSSDSKAPENAFLRELNMLGSMAEGTVSAVADAFSPKNICETSTTLGGAAAFGYMLARVLPTNRAASGAIRFLGVAATASFAKDAVINGSAVGNALVDSWNSDSHYVQNSLIMRTAGAKLVTDFGLMTAGGLAGDALGRRGLGITSSLRNAFSSSNELKLTGGLGLEPQLATVASLDTLRFSHARAVPLGESSGLRLVAEGAKTTEVVSRKVIDDKVGELQDRFGVLFTPEGRTIRIPTKWNQLFPGYENVRSLRTRAPEWNELVGLEAALINSGPSALPTKYGPVNFRFFDHPKDLAEAFRRDPARACWNKSAIMFVPESRDLAPLAQFNKGSITQSMEFLATHELAHNGQQRLGLDQFQNYIQYAKALGWELRTVGKRDVWALLTEEGRFGYNHRNGTWTYLEPFLQGKPTGLSLPSMTSAEVREWAKVRPITNYFPDPIEMITEGTAVFRLGKEPRQWLQQESPRLYSVVKDLHERELLLKR